MITKSGIGLVSGIALVLLLLVAVAVTNLPIAEGVASAGDPPTAECPVKQVAQDQGYGIAKTVTRPVCETGLSR